MQKGAVHEAAPFLYDSLRFFQIFQFTPAFRQLIDFGLCLFLFLQEAFYRFVIATSSGNGGVEPFQQTFVAGQVLGDLLQFLLLP